MPSPGDAGPTDWYSVLGEGTDATTEQIAAAVERLARQANALAITAPERARQLRDQVRAIKQDLLSGAESRQRYDQRLAARAAAGADSAPAPTPTAPPGYPTSAPAGPAPPPAPAAWSTASPSRPAVPGPATAPFRYSPPSPAKPAPRLMSRISKFLQTGWTCSGCGYGAQPTDKFCPRCGNRVESGLGDEPPHASVATGAQPTRCGKCGSWAAPGDIFCMRCGSGPMPGIS